MLFRRHIHKPHNGVHGTTFFLRTSIRQKWSNTPPLRGPGALLPCSQEPTTGSHSKTDTRNPLHASCFLQARDFNHPVRSCLVARTNFEMWRHPHLPFFILNTSACSKRSCPYNVHKELLVPNNRAGNVTSVARTARLVTLPAASSLYSCATTTTTRSSSCCSAPSLLFNQPSSPPTEQVAAGTDVQ